MIGFFFYAFVSVCTVVVSQSLCDSPFMYNPSIQKCVLTEYYNPLVQSSGTDICSPESVFDFNTCVTCRPQDLYVCDFLCVAIVVKEPNTIPALNNTATPVQRPVVSVLYMCTDPSDVLIGTLCIHTDHVTDIITVYDAIASPDAVTLSLHPIP